MRVTDAQYKILSNMSSDLGITRVEILSNVIALAKLLVDNKAKTVKIISKDGTEKEILLTLLMGNGDED